MFECLQRRALPPVDQPLEAGRPGYSSQHQPAVRTVGSRHLRALTTLRCLAVALLLLWVAPGAWSGEEAVVFTQSANGTRALRPFTVSGHWEVRWEVAGGPLSVWILDKDGNPIEKAAHTERPGKGSSYYAKPGTYSLRVIGSASEWSITVVQLP